MLHLVHRLTRNRYFCAGFPSFSLFGNMSNEQNGKTVKDVPADVFISGFADHLKKTGKVAEPQWADIVKTASFKQLPPQNPDWFFVHAASLARRVYIRGDLGVGASAKIYGGKNRRGGGHNHFGKGARGMNRNIFQQLEKAGFVAKSKNTKGGRRITSAGRRELDTVANQLQWQRPKFFSTIVASDEPIDVEEN
jgi:small subunit ribosomal protein S19e